MINQKQDRTIARVADSLVHREHSLTETGATHHRHIRDVLLSADQAGAVSTEVGKKLPSPDVSLRLLEHLADRSRIMAQLSLRLTIDEVQGCWSLPLTAEYTPEGISKYPLLTNKRLGMISVGAHRFMWQALIEDSIPPDTFLDHLCRAHACCNITHLEAVTPRENVLRGNLARHIIGGQGTLFSSEEPH